MILDQQDKPTMPRTLTLEKAVFIVVKKYGGIRATEAALGIDKSFLSRLMNGKKVCPSAKTLAKLGLKAVPKYEVIKGRHEQ
jgi:hypothetical protein